MQNPAVAPEQAFPVGIVFAVVIVAAVAIALVWWMKKTRGGRRAP